MLTDERAAAYLRSLETENSIFLEELEEKALQEGVPIIRKEVQGLLRFLLAWQKPARILEIGTAVGFSALLLWENAPKGARLTTLENHPERAQRARGNFRRAGAGEAITLLEGDAGEVLPTLEGPYDLIFLDGAKAQYIRYLPELLRLLGGG